MANAWPDVLTNVLVAVYRADQADPTLRRAGEVMMMEAVAHGGTAADGQRAIELWAERGCLARSGTLWKITDRGRDEARRIIKSRSASYLRAS
jgi:hypothetical protein